jgi:hypothetical protein
MSFVLWDEPEESTEELPAKIAAEIEVEDAEASLDGNGIESETM